MYWNDKHYVTLNFTLHYHKGTITDSFSVEFISNRKSSFGLVDGNNLKLPDFPSDIEHVSIIFKYKEIEMQFPKVGMDLILNKNKINWVFVVSYPPFNEMRIEE